MKAVIFDTVDEDTNGNGVMDWGEDSDNDGYVSCTPFGCNIAVVADQDEAAFWTNFAGFGPLGLDTIEFVDAAGSTTVLKEKIDLLAGEVIDASRMSVAALRQANRLRGDRIRIGQKLTIPRAGEPGKPAPVAEPAETYIVQNGDSLWRSPSATTST